ncbi:hypothetical protein DFO67_13123 [Modicisalibacter xianhensis]|uniref:Sodium:proline symporter n=1 Tax=Modicisalibacter xianhensis TaxID=442341 RepID=A0A4R8F943_9GAMM|nr:hypothetical protein [Halomonas xianhensis]TDX22140.1 hypothetical protein DFO67_13123 [Halomonas xianhensis]
MKSLMGEHRLSGKGIVWSGLLAGIVFMMLEMLMVWAFLGNSPWGPPRMIAAIVMGRDVLPPPANFAIGIMMLAMAIHFMLSWVYALVYGWVFGGLKLGMALLAGAVFGLAIYLLNFYGFTAVWPWFANARTWISIFAHLMFGIVLAGSYQAVANKADKA